MAGLADIFGGGGGDSGSLFGGGSLYGDMLTPEQKQALAFRGLMSAAGALGQAAMPSRMPVPIGAALGQAAGAMAQGQDEGAMSALKASLVGLQGQQLKSDLNIRDTLLKALGLGGGATGGTPASVPVTTPATGALGASALPSADTVIPSGGGGRGGWGPLATPAIQALTDAGHSQAAIQGIMANGLGEGGFNEPWQKAGGGENSFGHWQFNQGGELPGYLAWAQGKGDPKDTKLQAQYVARRMEQIVPGFSQITDPQQATDLVATKFERYQGAKPGQRYGYLADVQKAMGGGTLEPRLPLPTASGQLPEGALPAVPNFTGMVTGDQGPAYAPAASADLLSGGGTPTPAPAAAGGGTGGIVVDGKRYPSLAAWNLAQDKQGEDYGGLPASQQDAFVAALRAHMAQAPGATATPAAVPIAPASTQSTPIPQIQGPAVTPQIRLAQSNPLPSASVPTAPMPAFGSIAPPTAAPAVPNMQMGSVNLNDPRQVLALGILAEGAKMPGLGAMLTNTPQYKAAQAAASMQATKPIELQFAAPLASEGKRGELPYTGVSGAIQASKLYPIGSPERALADAFAAKTSGIDPILGGQRPGVPIQRWNPATQSYDIIGQVPRMPEGAMTMTGPSGTVTAAPVPGAADITQTMSTAHAAGPATFKPQEFHGPYGQSYLGTAAQLPGMTAQPSPGLQAALGNSGLMPGGALVPQATPAPSPSPTQQRPESRVPTFPVQTPGGVKDISDLGINDLFPGGQGIPAPAAPPPGMGYGKPNKTIEEMQKADAIRAEGYAKEGAENQKIYQDIAHLRDVLGRSLNTNKIAPFWTELTNIAHGLGADSIIPKQYDPADAATFQKATTDLVFAAVKKMMGPAKVAEIQGFAQANPNMVIPREANYSIVNDVLSTGKWQDARAKLASDYLTSTGGAPLSAFEARFNQAAPLADVTESYKNELRKQGAVFPGDPGQPSGVPTITKEQYDKMRPGTVFTAPDGTRRIKPGAQ